MSRASVTARGRAFAATGFVDTCRVERETDEDTNTLTGVVTRSYRTIYAGPCRIQAASATWAGPSTVGEAQVNLAGLELQLPVVGSEGILIDDRVTVTAATLDTELTGRVFHVVGQSHKTHATTRKLPLQEVLS